MKKIVICILTLGLILLGQNALAFQINSIVNLDAPYATIYHGTFDNLIIDFSLVTTKPDTVKAMSFKNLGSATYLNHIKYMKLWADAGLVGFQGLGIDREIGIFNYSIAYQSWYLENLSEKINDSQRFFVTVETYTSLTSTATIQMQIPLLADNNDNGSFEVGDFGIFMDSGNNGPTDANITNSNSQVISTTTVDSYPPKIVILNLADGATLNNNNYTISGLMRDQGNSYIRDFNINIDGQDYVIDNFDQYNYTWSYNWQNITTGAHKVGLLAHDGWGNFTQTPLINVTVNLQTLSLTNSSVTTDKTTLKNDGLDKAMVTVLIKDTANLPIKNRQIAVETSSDVIISNPNNNSDANGQIVFEARSVATGSKTLIIKADNQVLKTLTLSVIPASQLIQGVNFGDLIKASTPAVYYYGADGKRYVFANVKTYLTWYSDFSTVKTITDEQLASVPIGGNATYRPGIKLVKITTDPKVYAVDAHGTLKWLSTEQIATQLYGTNWASLVEDVPDSFFVNYKMGSPINSASDFDPVSVKNAASSINVDKGLM